MSVDAKLNRFEEWLVRERGIDTSSAAVYHRTVRLAYEGADPPTGRVRDRSLAPKTRRLVLVSLKAWSEYTQDSGLDRQLDRLAKNLPRPQRSTTREPLSRAHWRTLAQALEADHQLQEPMRAVLAILTIRGLRVGDVLRAERTVLAKGLTDGVVRLALKKEQRLDVTVKPIKRWVTMLLDYNAWERVEDLVSPGAGEKKREIARNHVQVVLRRFADQLGLDDVYPHRLRRTVATYFYEDSGRDLAGLMKYFGWSSVQTAMNYVDHDERERLDAIAERMRK